MRTSYATQDKEFLGEIGKRIKELRTKSELSQEKLSFECELDRTYIGSVERGERNISIINLYKIAKALKVPVADLLKF